jgi:hypothetical protein
MKTGGLTLANRRKPAIMHIEHVFYIGSVEESHLLGSSLQGGFDGDRHALV